MQHQTGNTCGLLNLKPYIYIGSNPEWRRWLLEKDILWEDGRK